RSRLFPYTTLFRSTGLCGTGDWDGAGRASLGSADSIRGVSISGVSTRADGSGSREVPDGRLGERLPQGDTYPASGHAQSTPKDAARVMERTLIRNLLVVRCI